MAAVDHRFARATFALKAELWVRRTRLAIIAPDLRHSRRAQADFHLSGCPNLASHLYRRFARDVALDYNGQGQIMENALMPAAAALSYEMGVTRLFGLCDLGNAGLARRLVGGRRGTCLE